MYNGTNHVPVHINSLLLLFSFSTKCHAGHTHLRLVHISCSQIYLLPHLPHSSSSHFLINNTMFLQSFSSTEYALHQILSNRNVTN
ncbi:MAG: hypothetical protein Q8S84_06690 [bacterium]|nr:hypothetical protein [bacterium]